MYTLLILLKPPNTSSPEYKNVDMHVEEVGRTVKR